MRLLNMLDWILGKPKPAPAPAPTPAPVEDPGMINGSRDLTQTQINQVIDAMPPIGDTQMATITSTVESNIGASAALSAKAFGAVGDGSFHAVTSQQISDWGVGSWATVGDSVDWVGIMRCYYSAYGTDPRNIQHNHDFYIPSGHYLVNKPVTLIGQGIRMRGDERNASIIETTNPNVPAIFCNYFSYGAIEHIAVWGTDGGTAAIVIDADGTYDGVLLKVQQLTLDSLTIDGRGGKIGLDVLPVGIGSGQGDTIQARSIFIGNCTRAGARFSGDNLLAFIFFGGNIQSCTHNGIEINGAQVFVWGTSFQTSNPLAVLSSGGADVYCSGGPSITSMKNVRSESVVGLIDRGNNAVVDTCQVYSVLNGQSQWAANTQFHQGDLITASDASGYKDGRLWVCVKAGISGSLEPAWALANGSVKCDDADWSVGNPNVSLVTGIPELPSNAIGPTGWVAILGTAGANGAPLYTTLVSQGPPVLADNPVMANPYPGLGIFIVGEAITDGTAQWVHWEFDTYRGGNINAVASNFGRVRAPIVTNSAFNRLDYMDSRQFATGNPGDWATGAAGFYANNVVSIANTWYAGTSLAEHSGSADPTGFQAVTQWMLRSALLFMAGANNNVYPDVGIFRGDASLVSGDKKNILALIGDCFGKITKTAADTKGDDTNIAGGLGTGTGGGGAVNLLVQPATTSGTAVPNPEIAAAVELPTGTDTALLVLQNGSLKRVHVGISDSGGSGQRLLTVDN